MPALLRQPIALRTHGQCICPLSAPTSDFSYCTPRTSLTDAGGCCRQNRLHDLRRPSSDSPRCNPHLARSVTLRSASGLCRHWTAEVTPVYLCGAQALAVAYAKRWRTVTEEFDYGDKYGVAIDGIYGVRKIIFGSGAGDTDDLKDHGVVTGFFATTGTATVAAAAAAED